MPQRVYSIILFIALAYPAFAQDSTKVPVKKPVNLKQEVVINKKRFRIYNNWIEGGAGYCYNSINPKIQFMLGADYNFHISDQYFQAGFFLSGDRFGNYNNYNMVHLCYGRRKENAKMNLAFFGGLSYSTGYQYMNGTFETNTYHHPGIYLSAHYIHKLFYDIGIGPSAFIDINALQTTGGVRINLFFSGAYRGEK